MANGFFTPAGIEIDSMHNNLLSYVSNLVAYNWVLICLLNWRGCIQAAITQGYYVFMTLILHGYSVDVCTPSLSHRSHTLGLSCIMLIISSWQTLLSQQQSPWCYYSVIWHLGVPYMRLLAGLLVADIGVSC